MGMEPPSDIHVMSARKMPMVPSVTMKGSILPTVTIRPFSNPQAAPTANPTTAPTKIALAPIDGSRWFMVRIMMPVTNAIMDPTDKSRHPDEITNVAPTAIMAIKAERVTTLLMLVSVAKLLLTKIPATMTSARAINGPMAAHRIRRGDLSIVSSVVALVMVVSSHATWWAGFGKVCARMTAGGGIDHILFGNFARVQFCCNASSTHHKNTIRQADQFL